VNLTKSTSKKSPDQCE